MKRIIVFLVVLIFTFMFFPPVEAVVFKKGDKVTRMQTGEVYEFRLDADIGIYGADSGLGDLYIVNGKVYAITPTGVEGMKAVSNAVDLQTELDKTLKLYHKKRAEAGRAWKYLAAEKEKVKKLQKERDALKEKVAELEKIVGMANQTLKESKDVLTITKGVIKSDRDTIKVQKRKANLLKAYIIILFVITAFMIVGSIIYSRRKPQEITAETPEPAEEVETIDLTDLT